MIIRIVGEGVDFETLKDRINQSIQMLGFGNLVDIKTDFSNEYKAELGITKNPALCIEEESIDFKDMIFEGSVPEQEEIDAMFMSIFGGEEDGESCGSGGCDDCSGGCGCH